jgi:hypothetical protein
MTLQQALNTIQPGKTIYLKGGTYKYSATISIKEGNNGNSNAMKNVFAYGSDKPVLDFSSMSEDASNRGILLCGNYWYLKGITVRGAGDNGILIAGSNNKMRAAVLNRTMIRVFRYPGTIPHILP